MSSIQFTPDLPNAQSFAYNEMAQSWQLILHLLGGTRAMRKAGKLYLPQEEGESHAAWNARLTRSFLYNGYRKGIQNLVGKAFASPMVISDKMPANLTKWAGNIDRNGRQLSIFMRDLMADSMNLGLSHILVDMPKKQPGNTRADDAINDTRPYWVHVSPRNILGWQSAYKNGVEYLTQLRIREYVTVQAGQFGEKRVERMRVLTPEGYEIFQQNMVNGAWERIEDGEMTLGRIPLHTFYTNRTGFMTGLPWFEDLAQLNLAHWQSYSDQRHILHIARVPLLFGSGIKSSDDKSPIVVAPNRIIHGPSGSDLKYVEHTGKAIQSGRDDLKDLEDRMRLMALEPLMQKSGFQSATGKVIDFSEENSLLGMWTVDLEDVTKACFETSANWMKETLPDGARVKANSDFGLTMNEMADLQTLLGAVAAGKLSNYTFLTEMKRRGRLNPDLDVNAELRRIQDEKDAFGADDEELPLEPPKEPDPGKTALKDVKAAA